MLNRSVLIVRYQQPFVDWINAVEPDKPELITLEEARENSTAYLIEVEDEEELSEWLDLNGGLLFEEELEGWYTDPQLWPQDRSLALLKQWCTFDLHTMVRVTGSSPLEDDEDEEWD
jgi:hypothetical protein